MITRLKSPHIRGPATNELRSVCMFPNYECVFLVRSKGGMFQQWFITPRR